VKIENWKMKIITVCNIIYLSFSCEDIWKNIAIIELIDNNVIVVTFRYIAISFYKLSLTIIMSTNINER